MSSEHDLPRNELLCGDARDILPQLPDESVQLTVTSPPYNIGKNYEGYDDRQPLPEWKELMRDVFEELFRLTAPDGKVCINVGVSFGQTDVDGRYFRIPLNRHIIDIAQDVGFDLFDEYIWVKPSFASHGGGALFGSYPYPTNFMANQQHEYVLVFRKWVSEHYHETRDIPAKGTSKREESKLTKDEWREFTKSVWEIPPAKPSKFGFDHPAMFPVALPERLVRLYSFVDDVVLDPFIGTGATAIAAEETDRAFVGIDQNEEYIDVAEKRLSGTLPRRTRDVTKGARAKADAAEHGHEQLTLGGIADDETAEPDVEQSTPTDPVDTDTGNSQP